MPGLGAISALTALRTHGAHQKAMARTMERLATGRQLNRASDNPAGMAAANNLAARRATLEEVVKQAEVGRALLDTAEGALGQVSDLLIELGSLAVASANDAGLTPAEREANQDQADSILQSIDSILKNTTFNRRHIFVDGAGFSSGDTYISVPTLSPGSLGLEKLAAGGELNLESGDLEAAQKAIKSAQETVGGVRASIGSLHKHTLGAQVDVAQIELENTVAAESHIVDADLAKETADLIRTQTLAEASLAVLKIAQQSERSVLDLIRV